jgi:hypothetical protein
MDIAITALVDHESASRLNAGSKDIKNVLILHLMNGKDQFIPMTAQFGELLSIPCPSHTKCWIRVYLLRKLPHAAGAAPWSYTNSVIFGRVVVGESFVDLTTGGC